MASNIKKSDIKKARRVLKRLPVAVAIILVVLVVAYFILEQFGFSIWSLIYKRDPVDGQVIIHIIDIGQGDSILIETSAGFMLIDAGESSEEDTLKKYLRKMGISTLSYLVLTHPHTDHVGGADMILEEFKVENIIYDNYNDSYGKKEFTELVSLINTEGANIVDPKQGDKFFMGDAEFTVLYATDDSESLSSDVNDYSIVLRLDYGESSFVFTGDATTAVEADIIETFSRFELDCDFLKSGHHGSTTSSGKKFIDILTPEIVAISCGEGNRYGHPHADVLETYSKAKSTVYRTDLSGSLVFVSDGKTITYSNGEQ